MYGFSVRMKGDFSSIVDQTTAALKEQGFGVLADIDVQGTLKAKLDKDMLPYRILGACAPPLASRALEVEPDIGMLLPCNVVVRAEQDGGVLVSIVDPRAMLSVVKNDKMGELANEVAERLLRVRDALAES